MDHANRRRIKRFPGENRRVILRTESREYIARVSDFSVLGIGLITRENLQPDASLVLMPTNPPVVPPPAIRIRVEHTSKRGDEFVIGCSFPHVLRPEEVIALDG